MNKKIINPLIIIGIILLAFILILIKPKKPVTNEEVAKCIGDNSILYVQLGCPHCENQKELFGENYKYINEIDCFYERDQCNDITVTPTWKIKGEFYKGVKSIEELKELTNC